MLAHTLRTTILTAVLFFVSPTQAQPADKADHFPVFDSMLYSDKPYPEALGLDRIHMIYGQHFWIKGQSHDEPIERQVRSVARRIPANSLVCLDVEHWPMSGPEVSESLRKLIAILTWVRDERPDLKLGYYGLIPIRNYWYAIRKLDDPDRKQWVEDNKRLDPLAEHVDVLFPSLYTFYPDQHGWEKYAKANLEQARRYNKPVYAFLMPTYHNSNKQLSGQYLSADYWAMELRVCYEHADGVVIWGGGRGRWNKNMSWWQATLKFLDTKKGS